MYAEPEPSEARHPTSLGRYQGSDQRQSPERAGQTALRPAQGNCRAQLCLCQGVARSSLRPLSRTDQGAGAVSALGGLSEYEENGPAAGQESRSIIGPNPSPRLICAATPRELPVGHPVQLQLPNA